MFYCDKCAEKHQHPKTKEEYRSLGPCEYCDEVEPCNDIPQNLFPFLKTNEKAR